MPYLGHVLDSRDVGKPENWRDLQVPLIRWGLFLGWGQRGGLLCLVDDIRQWRHLYLWCSWYHLLLEAVATNCDVVGHLKGR